MKKSNRDLDLIFKRVILGFPREIVLQLSKGRETLNEVRG